MHDSHCHIDSYACPEEIANAAESARVLTVAVTNLPTAFTQGEPYLRGLRYVKLATGLHPLLAEHHTPAQRRLFAETLERTDFVGEIGLDYSQRGRLSRDVQIDTFEFVLNRLVDRGKFVTLHSRRAEGDVRGMLAAQGISPVVFHWYSGAVGELERILADGHYLSINPRMLVSKNGLRIVERIPRGRGLLETDGPFCKLEGRELVPADTATVCGRLAELWHVSIAEAEAQLDGNLKRVMRAVGVARTAPGGVTLADCIDDST